MSGRLFPINVKHHFIPQFLLKAWADTTEDKRIEVFRLDLPHLPSSRRAPGYTGYEDNLYTLTKPEVAGVAQQAVEIKFLQSIDSEGARVLRKISTNNLGGQIQLPLKDRYCWALFIISLRFRAPGIVSRLRAEAPDYLMDSLNARPEEYDSLALISDPPTLTEFVEINHPGYIENFGMMSLGKLICDQERVEQLMYMRWWMCDFSGLDGHLLLADRPCVFTAGMDSPDLVIALPVSPSKAFMATKTDHVGRIIRQQRLRDLMRCINESSLIQAERRIYAPDESPRRFIRELLVKENTDQG